MLSLIVCSAVSNAQFIMDLIDTTKQMGKGMLKIYEKYDHLKISGYMQPQWQVAQAAGANTYSGGNFSTFSNNRFMLRRGRIKFEYVDFPEKKGPSLQFVFQFDGTEKGVAIRDFWGRILENHYKVFSFTAGMFPRPFGYEVNLSSSERESPERGRMSQILMKGERDLGAMGSFEPRLKTHSLYNLKIDIGVFNGQGINSSAEMDSYKDLVGRISLKPVDLSSKIKFSAGTSGFNGGFRQNTAYVYSTVNKMLVVDSSSGKESSISSRRYYGGDAQIKIVTRFGFTELRGEFITGTQPATEFSSETPLVLVSPGAGLYKRDFAGAYFYLLNNIINTNHQVVIKYDWYDPNRHVSGTELGPAGKFSEADIKFSTLGIGYIYQISNSTKLVLFYEKVTNETTRLPGYTGDIKDNVFTTRLQFKF